MNSPESTRVVAQSSWWQNHADAVLTGVAVAAIGGLVTMLWSINAKMTEVSTRVINNEARLDRIANAIPEVRERIAVTDVNVPWDFALVQFKSPKDLNAAPQFVYFDAIKQKAEIWKAADNHKHAYASQALVGCFVPNVDVTKSFQQLEAGRQVVKDTTVLPPFVDAKNSWAGSGATKNCRDDFVGLDYRLTKETPLESATLTYKEMVKKLQSKDIMQFTLN